MSSTYDYYSFSSFRQCWPHPYASRFLDAILQISRFLHANLQISKKKLGTHSTQILGDAWNCHNRRKGGGSNMRKTICGMSRCPRCRRQRVILNTWSALPTTSTAQHGVAARLRMELSPLSSPGGAETSGGKIQIQYLRFRFNWWHQSFQFQVVGLTRGHPRKLQLCSFYTFAKPCRLN